MILWHAMGRFLVFSSCLIGRLYCKARLVHGTWDTVALVDREISGWSWDHVHFRGENFIICSILGRDPTNTCGCFTRWWSRACNLCTGCQEGGFTQGLKNSFFGPGLPRRRRNVSKSAMPGAPLEWIYRFMYLQFRVIDFILVTGCILSHLHYV